MEPDTDALRVLLEIARLTPEALAMQTGLNVGTVRRTLNGQTAPHQATRSLFANALGVPLWRLTRVVWPQTDISEEERAVHRRELLRLAAGGSAAAAASLLPHIDPPEISDRAARLVAGYGTTKPSVMFSEAADLLDALTEVLNPSLPTGQHRQVLADAVDTASVAAWSAVRDGRSGRAVAYFAAAREFADRSRIDFLKGVTLASAARLDRPIAGNNPAEVLNKLGVAIPLLGNSVSAQWATLMEAEAHAARNQPYPCEAALERAHRMVPFDSGEGFFSSAGMLPDLDSEDAFDSWAGLCYAHLGQPDKAVAHVARALQGDDPQDMVTPVVVNSNAALAYAVAGEPEESCAHAVHALDGAQETGYRAGVVRVRQVRARLEEWAPSECVQELDERLLLVP